MNTEEITAKLGLSLNSMQKEVCDAMLNTKNDVVVLSPTGSGKTYAYLIPVAQMIDATSDDVQAVVLTPSRELALQSDGVLRDMRVGLRSTDLYGGRPAMDEHRELRKIQPQVVFATPGRINDHLDKGNVSADHVGLLVIDEFDKMLTMGFQDEMDAVISKLPNVNRIVLLSATTSDEINRVCKSPDTVYIDHLSPANESDDRLNLFRVDSPIKDKLDTLAQLLLILGNESSIVFLNYRESVERTAGFLSENGFSVSLFHGGLDQDQREAALYRFSNGSALTLVCTDLASRGLDIPDVANIIHFHLPENEDAYIHRVGRTARWDKKGRAFFILGPGESVPTYVGDSVPDKFPVSVELSAGLRPALPKMGTIYIGKGKKEKLSKGDILGFLCKKGGLKGDEIGRIDVRDRYSYVAVRLGKIKQLLRLTKGEKIKGIKTVVEEVQ